MLRCVQLDLFQFFCACMCARTCLAPVRAFVRVFIVNGTFCLQRAGRDAYYCVYMCILSYTINIYDHIVSVI